MSTLDKHMKCPPMYSRYVCIITNRIYEQMCSLIRFSTLQIRSIVTDAVIFKICNRNYSFMLFSIVIIFFTIITHISIRDISIRRNHCCRVVVLAVIIADCRAYSDNVSRSISRKAIFSSRLSYLRPAVLLTEAVATSHI